MTQDELLSERQILFQAALGARLSDAQARAFAVACRASEVTVSQLKAVLGVPGPEVIALADSLVTQVLFKPVVAGKRYALADHIRARLDGTDRAGDQAGGGAADLVTAQVQAGSTDLSTAQVARPSADLSTAQVKSLERLTEAQWRIASFCDVPRRLAEIMDHLKIVNRGHFKEHHIEPLLQARVLTMTNPANPRASNQRYVLTEDGAKLKAMHRTKHSDQDGDLHGEA